MRTAAFIFLLAIAVPSLASLKDIKREKLPEAPRVLQAYEDALRLERMAERWTPEWKYEQPKDSAKEQLASNLAVLQQEASAAPENAELWLLVSIVARYGYNLEVPNAHDAVIQATERVERLAPVDIRARWFLAAHQCQTMDFVNRGMQLFLELESAREKQLPASFWDDYMECATVASMPAHLLRAADRRMKLDAEIPAFQQFIINGARDRFDTADPAKKYDYKEIWIIKADKTAPVFSSDLFGFSFAAKGDWPVNLCVAEKLECFIDLEAGPFMNGKEKVFPHIMIAARQPKKGESLADFFKSFMHYEGAHAVDAPCPSDLCQTQEAVTKGMYKKNGDGHVIMTAFQREEPTSPGLLWEEPAGPAATASSEPKYFRPRQRLKRLSGAIYYLVVLDTASSIYPQAKAEYDNFLETMRIE